MSNQEVKGKQIWMIQTPVDVSNANNFLLGPVQGFPQAQEIIENLENHEKKFHAWKNHGI